MNRNVSPHFQSVTRYDGFKYMAKSGLQTLLVGVILGWGIMQIYQPQKSSKILPVSLPSSISVNQSQGSLMDLENAVYLQVNEYRRSKNLPPLSLNSQISIQARIHSQNMASGKVRFSHDGFKQRVQAMKIPYRSVAENVAYNQGFSDPVTNAVKGWIKSPGHRQNMEGQFNLTGIGMAKNSQGEYYFTQIFMNQL